MKHTKTCVISYDKCSSTKQSIATPFYASLLASIVGRGGLNERDAWSMTLQDLYIYPNNIMV